VESELKDLIRNFTAANPEVAIAESTEDFGCTVYARGTEMLAWASHKVEELVAVHLRNGAVITTRHESVYFLLSKDEAENFQLIHGPLKPSELVAHFAA